MPGSSFNLDVLSALTAAGAVSVPWEEALGVPHDLIVTASPKGGLGMLQGPQVLLPHGAGFNKALIHEGTPTLPSGLDPAYLLEDGLPRARYALAHGSQLARLAQLSPPAAARASVVGDPMAERLLASASRRESFREALGTGDRSLVVLASTWGPRSLLSLRPELAHELTALLPYDEYQFALIAHPNMRSAEGTFELHRLLAPALRAGLVLADPREEWASMLLAADVVISDHGSTALYGALAGCPVLRALPGDEMCAELVLGTPMHRLLHSAPHVRSAGDLPDVLAAHESTLAEQQGAAVHDAFDSRQSALAGLRALLYSELELVPPHEGPYVLPLPLPEISVQRRPGVFGVRTELTGDLLVVERSPSPVAAVDAHHLAAEFGLATESEMTGAGVIYRRRQPLAALGGSRWTAGGWTSQILLDYPACRTAAVILSPERVVLRRRRSAPVMARVRRVDQHGRVYRPDPAAVLSAAHAWLARQADPQLPTQLVCVVGRRSYSLELTPACPSDMDEET